MYRFWLSAAIVAATVLIGDPAIGDKNYSEGVLFADGATTPLDDNALAGAVGMGLGDGGLASGPTPGGSQSAVILWDEARPPITPPPGSGTIQQSGGRVVVTDRTAAGSGY